METHYSLLFPRAKIKFLHPWVKLSSAFPDQWRLCHLAQSSLRRQVHLSFSMTLEFTKPSQFFILSLSSSLLLPFSQRSILDFPITTQNCSTFDNTSKYLTPFAFILLPLQIFLTAFPVHQLFHFIWHCNFPIPLFSTSLIVLSSRPFSSILHQLPTVQWCHLPCTLIYIHPNKFQAQILLPVTYSVSFSRTLNTKEETTHLLKLCHNSFMVSIFKRLSELPSKPVQLFSQPLKGYAKPPLHLSLLPLHSQKMISPPTSKTVKNAFDLILTPNSASSVFFLLPQANMHARLGRHSLLTSQVLPLS